MSHTLPGLGTPVAAPFAVGDRFVFVGLSGQEPDPGPIMGSGSVGWVIEVVHISPFGRVGVFCAPTVEEVPSGRVASVGLADAMAMVASGIWQPIS